jgi:hypothetical protein
LSKTISGAGNVEHITPHGVERKTQTRHTVLRLGAPKRL